MSIDKKYIARDFMIELMSHHGNPKVGKLVEHLVDIYHQEAPDDVDGIKCIDIDAMGVMRFLPKGKEVKLIAGGAAYSNEDRQEGRYGKILSKIMKERGKEGLLVLSELEALVNLIKAKYKLEGSFKVLSGEDIRWAYLEDNYDESGFNTGTLESSCMRYEYCQDACSIYVDNSDHCSILVLLSDDNKVRGRALVWECSEGRTWLDRIYANDHITEAFKIYAKGKGWSHKEYQNRGTNNSWVNPDGSVTQDEVTIPLSEVSYSVYPYMDTFSYVYTDGAKNFSSIFASSIFFAQEEPDQQMGQVWDDIDECNISEEDAIYLDYREIYTHVYNCSEVGGEYYLSEDVVSITRTGTMYAKNYYKDDDEIAFCEHRLEYVHLDDYSVCEWSETLKPNDEIEYLEDLDVNVHTKYIDEVYEDRGWFKNSDGDWVEELEEDEVEEEA
ncbi:hypothetical protein Calle1_50 [Cellulophaga phage Calle_1]|uniref:Uncharacterized protein n=1 Tax=Cellulophaga phage Calle_1 TaxID=2745643 RepID=A0A8E4ZKW7_9CAUD|nr:hypothetical protein M1M22_gp065 [Cellulophaga phage Calle_1]QQV89765.1 hypothetical protein Calle1_50 [Cellulophaga phage Calle_1]